MWGSVDINGGPLGLVGVMGDQRGSVGVIRAQWTSEELSGLDECQRDTVGTIGGSVEIFVSQ